MSTELEQRIVRIESRLVQVMIHLGLDPAVRTAYSPSTKPVPITVVYLPETTRK